MIPTNGSVSSGHAHVVTIDRAQQRMQRPWMRWAVWTVLLASSLLLLDTYVHRVSPHDGIRVFVLGFVLSIGMRVVVWDTTHWQRRCFIERMARLTHARGCWHRCTVVVCADPTVVKPFTNALWTHMRRRRTPQATTVLVCHTASELRPLLRLQPRGRVVVVTTDLAWAATTGGQR